MTKPVQRKPPPQWQPQVKNETSVQSKIRAFTQKFENPPVNLKPPQPKLQSEPAPSSKNRRRPRKNESTASEQLQLWEGNKPKNFVTDNKIGGLEGKGTFLTNLDQ